MRLFPAATFMYPYDQQEWNLWQSEKSWSISTRLINKLQSDSVEVNEFKQHCSVSELHKDLVVKTKVSPLCLLQCNNGTDDELQDELLF